ncbi:MAG: GntR family transcriptional regulator [Acetobacteraceae bacterium]|jgi:DNA-binding GntR family transcriptional regulator
MTCPDNYLFHGMPVKDAGAAVDRGAGGCIRLVPRVTALAAFELLWQIPAMQKSKKKDAASPRRRVAKAEGQPRYLVVADALIADIVQGRYPVGSTLPTEHELCDIFKISRFTVREALRRLRESGLVTRKPRAGTTVIASQPSVPYTQALESLDDLLQYAENTEMRLSYTDLIEVDQALASELPIGVGEKWLFGHGIRFRKHDDLPICRTRVYINPAFRGIADRLTSRSGAIYRLIEKQYDVHVARVEQRILAIALSSEDALHLKAETNSPALRILRLYYDGNGRILEASDSTHPGERFSYAITIGRAR